jgi:hypothetical protein
MEYCGAYHFGQWVHIFAEQPHYESPKSDLQQSATQDEFGHPYAFIGIPGIGAGMGWESLMYNTGQYVPPPSVLTPRAVIRGVAYYDYVSRMYRLSDMKVPKADFYVRNKPPPHETFHNPLPARKFQKPFTSIMISPPFKPYVGTLTNRITQLIEANQSVPPFNYAFVLESVAGVQRVDPRPKSMWQTELERIWSGPSARYWHNNGSLLHPGLQFTERNCTDFIAYGYQEASPNSCGEDGRFSCFQPVRGGGAGMNDFRSWTLMYINGWVFTWDNLLKFKPYKNVYDPKNLISYSSFWGLNDPLDGSIFRFLVGMGTITVDFGNSYVYGDVKLYLNNELKAVAPPLTPRVEVTFDYRHMDVLRFYEETAVIVIHKISILCWGCCPQVDAPNIIATSCNVGVAPTMCKDTTRESLTSTSGFRVLDTTPYFLASGTR